MAEVKYEFDSYRAVGVAEGFEETSGLEESLAAWQYLIDNDICWSLQGWFGRQAQMLIDEGLCHPKNVAA